MACRWTRIPQGLKPSCFPGVFGTTEEAAEKWGWESESAKRLPSGPKGRIDFAQLAARVNSCPFKTRTFSIGREVLPFHESIDETGSSNLETTGKPGVGRSGFETGNLGGDLLSLLYQMHIAFPGEGDGRKLVS